MQSYRKHTLRDIEISVIVSFGTFNINNFSFNIFRHIFSLHFFSFARNINFINKDENKVKLTENWKEEIKTHIDNTFDWLNIQARKGKKILIPGKYHDPNKDNKYISLSYS